MRSHVRHFYTVPTALLAAQAPKAQYEFVACPGTPTISLVVVHQWDDHASQDAWEDLPGVNEHYPENLGQLAPPGVVTALAPIGVAAGMTMREVFQQLRRWWPCWRA